MKTKTLVPVRNQKIRKRKGFTLIELIVVIAILAILAAIAIPAFTGTLNNAKKSTDEASKKVVQSAVRLFQAEKGSLPSALDDAEFTPYLDGGLPTLKYYTGFSYTAATGEVSLTGGP